jgi:hypothetical protein
MGSGSGSAGRAAVLDDGRLADSHGRTVDFRNTVVIMTSNIGLEFLMQGVTIDGRCGKTRPVCDWCASEPLPTGVPKPGR